MQRIVAGGAANGRFKLLRDLVASNVNTHKGRVVFKCSAYHLREASKMSIYIPQEFVILIEGASKKVLANLTTIISQSVGGHINPSQSGIKPAKA